MTGQERYMARAVELARECVASGDVPVGCVIVDGGGNIVGEGRNRREERGSAEAHAEIEAIRAACARLGSWRLAGCRLYVTLEPCPMCAGAILNARLDEVHYGAPEPESGCCGSVLNLFAEEFPHAPAVYRGPLTDVCAELLRTFFRARRQGEGNLHSI